MKKSEHIHLNFIAIFIFLFPFYFSCQQPAEESGEVKQESKDSVISVKLPAPESFSDSLDSKPVFIFFLKNKQNMQAALTNYGARMVGLWVPDKNGKLLDIVAGFGSLKDYVSSEERYYGAIVGRYGNRIAKGKFSLDGKSYKLDINNPPNTLHGGRTGFHSRVWDALQKDSQTVIFSYVSPDGEEGYPGKLTVSVTYRLTDDNALYMNYEVYTDKKTVINITNHNFWNLNGEGNGTINNHELMIAATHYTPVDSTLIPVGIAPVANTPLDFTKPMKIGVRLDQNNEQLKFGNGYDHNFVLEKKKTGGPELAAVVKGDLSGIVMEILTTEPGVQFYGGNFMKGRYIYKNGSRDEYRTAFCLETQHFPDSPNQPAFPSTVLEPGKKYFSETIHRFQVAK